MALTTYNELQDAIASWLARSDLAATIPDLVALGEQRIFYGAEDGAFASPPLRLRAMETSTDPALVQTTPDVATLPLPDGFLGARALTLAGPAAAALELAPLAAIRTAENARGRPCRYAIDGDTIRFAPVPDAAYGVALAYWRRFDPLATVPTNWLLANAPGIYLYAALLEAQPFLMNDARLPVWAAMFAGAARALAQADAESRLCFPLRLQPAAALP